MLFPHVIFHLVLNTCVTKHGINLFYNFATETKWNVAKDNIEIQDPHFIARSFLMPSNSIVDVMINILVYKNTLPKNVKAPSKNKFQFFLLYDLLCQMMQVVLKFGLQPECKNEQSEIVSLVKLHQEESEKQVNPTFQKMSIKGATQAILYTLPTFFHNAYYKKEKNNNEETTIFFNTESLLKQTFYGLNTTGALKESQKESQLKMPTSLEELLIPKSWNISTVFSDILNSKYIWKFENPCEPFKVHSSPLKKRQSTSSSKSITNKKLKITNHFASDQNSDNDNEENIEDNRNYDDEKETSEIKEATEIKNKQESEDEEEENNEDKKREEHQENESSNKKILNKRKKSSLTTGAAKQQCASILPQLFDIPIINKYATNVNWPKITQENIDECLKEAIHTMAIIQNTPYQNLEKRNLLEHINQMKTFQTRTIQLLQYTWNKEKIDM